MASTWFLFRLCASAVVVAKWFGVSAAPDAILHCPDVFENGTDNPITYILNSAEITKTGCNTPVNVVFRWIPKGQSSAIQLCAHRYPPLACNDFATSDTCGCVQQDGADYTYKYTFPVDGSQEGGKIEIGFCFGNSQPFEEEVAPSCNSISFTRCGFCPSKCPSKQLACGLALFFVVVIVGRLNILAFYKLHNKRCRQIVVLVLVALMWVLIAVALYCSCKGLPEDDRCEDLCVGLAVAFIFIQNEIAICFLIFCLLKDHPEGNHNIGWLWVLFVIFVPVIGVFALLVYFILKEDSTERRIIWALLLFGIFVPIILIVVALVYIHCKNHLSGDIFWTLVCMIAAIIGPGIGIIVFLVWILYKKCAKPTALPPAANITSPSEGSSSDSYDLTWTVPETDSTAITQFKIEYAEVEGQVVIGRYKNKSVDGTARSAMLEGLSVNTQYEVYITSVNERGRTKGPRFTFRTARSIGH